MFRCALILCLVPALVLFSACDDQLKIDDSCGDAFIDPGEQGDGTLVNHNLPAPVTIP